MPVRFHYKPGFLHRPQVTDGLSFLLALIVSLAGFGLLLGTVNPLVALLPIALLGTAAVLWRFPVASIFLLLLMATLSEATRENISNSFTDNIRFWNPLSSSGRGPLPVSPAEFLIVASLAAWFVRGHLNQTLKLHFSPLLWSYGWYLLAVLGGLVYGLLQGGAFNVSIWEIRPLLYGPIMLFLALNLIDSRRHLDILGWIVVLGTGLKGLQGSWRYLVTYGGDFQGNSLLDHDEAFFFPAFYIFLGLLLLFGGSRKQKYATLLLLPWVVLADLANNRRSSTGALIVCLVVLVFILFKVLQNYRLHILRAMLAAIVLVSVYTGVFWNSSSRLAQPLRAIKSQTDPSQRDAGSDLYRDLEFSSMMLDIRDNPLIGRGYGSEMRLLPGMADIREFAPLTLYIPHNSILWIWWRLGLIGFVLFWMAMGLVIVRNCQLASTSADPDVRRWAIFAVCVTVMFLLIGWWDIGVLRYRIVGYMWIVIAAAEAARYHLAGQHATDLMRRQAGGPADSGMDWRVQPSMGSAELTASEPSAPRSGGVPQVCIFRKAYTTASSHNRCLEPELRTQTST